MLAGEAQEAGQLGQGVGQARDRCGVAVAVAAGEGLGPAAGFGDGLLARVGGDVVEDLPEGGLDLVLGVLWDLGEQVPTALCRCLGYADVAGGSLAGQGICGSEVGIIG